ncbi:hypothetical protein F4780DRAFT_600267 [Xylariomycetidae sp. FL0641]|nr:hypothetical protein F4780DRAFT_600267 [Xylariomycetidae sp. FL0641]
MVETHRMSSQPSWGRWPPHHSTSGYPMMDQSGIMPYNNRTTTTEAMHKDPMASHFHMAPTFTISAVATIHGTQYSPQHSFGLAPFAAQHPAFMVPPRAYQDERLFPRVTDVDTVDVPAGFQSGQGQVQEEYPSHSSETKPIVLPPSPPASSEPNEGAPSRQSRKKKAAPVSTTTTAEVLAVKPIDKLMKVIQEKDKDPAPTDYGASGYPSPPNLEQSDDQDPAKRPHACRRENCDRRFRQRTHLQIHDHSHTGCKPYLCPWPGCGSYHSQRGNLKSHIRRHTGETPFVCSWPGCGRGFPQKGNLTAHMETHEKKRRFHCILEGCNKPFGAKGNLKNHQNVFHVAEVERLMSKFASMDPSQIQKADEHDHTLYLYLKQMYPHSNKGIKGRGPGRTVKSGVRGPSTSREFLSVHQAPMPVCHGLSTSGFGQYNAPNAAYDMYDADQATISSGTMTPTSTSGMMETPIQGTPKP